MASKVPVWLDCDPGHDDALAMLIACYHPGIELLGVSTVFGNASLANTTHNASAVLTAIGQRHVPVHQGAAKALYRPFLHPPTDIHGVTGLDGTTLLPAPMAPIISPAAVDPLSAEPESPRSTPAVVAMAAALRATAPGTAWVVATGCLTNVAALFLEHPDLAAHVAGVSAMGGAIGGGFTDAILGPPMAAVDHPDTFDSSFTSPSEGKQIERIGNWTVWAEWNIFADPEAAKFVIEEVPELRSKVTLVPLDLTHQLLTTPEVRELILRGPEGVRGVDMEGGEKKENVEVKKEAEREGRALGTGEGKTTLRTMFVELLMFFASTYKDVFNIPSPPLHDPIAVAAVLIGTQYEIPFYDWDHRKKGISESERERFAVRVVTDGTYEEAFKTQASGGPQTGRTIAEALPAGEQGVRIPRGMDVEKFWTMLEECLVRADAANAAAADGVV